MYSCYMISKYDPVFYKDGVFTRNEWTDFSDVGKIFNNTKLSLEEYERIEQNYINFVVDIFEFIGVTKFKIIDLEIYNTVPWKNRQTISLSRLPNLIRDCLRNSCWCKIQSTEFCLCFGFDYYLHLNCTLDYYIVNNISKKNSLFLRRANGILCK